LSRWLVPAAGGTVSKSPSEVTLHFSEKLEGALSSIVVRDTAGKQIDKGDGTVDKKDRTVIRVSLPALEPGVYKVEWRAVSADTSMAISPSRSASSRRAGKE